MKRKYKELLNMERDLKSVERKSRNRERKSGRNIEEM
jgi:hypothetical protein